MKKIIISLICLTLVVLTCFFVFTACDDGVVEKTALPSESTPVTSETYAVDIDYFYGVVKDCDSKSTVMVDVTPKYYSYFGDTLEVQCSDIKSLEIREGDTIRVVIEDIKKDKTIKVDAKYVQVVKCGNDKQGYSTNRFTLANVSELEVNNNLAAFFEPLHENYVKWERVDSSNNGYSDTAARVVEISDNKVYFTETFGKVANYVIDGIPDCSFSVGDCVTLEYDGYYETSYTEYYSVNTCYKIPLEDITIFRKATNQEIESQYREPSDDPFAHWKPVIYLYPEEEMECSLRVNLKGELTCTYPEHGEYGWQNFTAMPDGTLIFPDGREYYCLYWEGEADMEPDLTKGFCVKGSDTAEFLTDILPKTGLTPREANEFIIFWLPILQKNEYNLITFQTEAYTSIAELEINPNPDSLLRVYMVAKPLDAPVDIEPQTFEGFERKGFTVVEWGGSIMNHKVE